jgi:hypothetical protein
VEKYNAIRRMDYALLLEVGAIESTYRYV